MYADRRYVQLIIITAVFLFIIIEADAEMVISSFSPETVPNTNQVTITVYGNGFQTEQIWGVDLVNSSTNCISCTSSVVKSNSEMTVKFELSGADPGHIPSL